MTAALTRTAIVQYAIQRGIADYVVDNYLTSNSEEAIEHARITVMQYAEKIAPHVAKCVEDDLRRAAEHRASDIGNLLDMVSDTLEWGFVPYDQLDQETPSQEPTKATPEQINHAMAMRQALADVVAGWTGRGELADQIERVAAGLVASLRTQPPPPVDEQQSRP